MSKTSSSKASSSSKTTSTSRRPFRIGRAKTGLGLFATKLIRRGSFIVRYTGRMLPNKIADELDTKYLFEVNARWTVDGSSRKNVARYVNHSCRPNAEADVKKRKILISAIKTISAQYKVVGTAVIPPNSDSSRLGEGAITIRAGTLRMAPPGFQIPNPTPTG